MVAPALLHCEDPRTIMQLLEPDLLVDGVEPEQRVVYSGISWERYLEIDKELGDDRAFPRLYYLDGELEIMSTSDEHERLVEFVGSLLDIYFEETGTEIVPRGHATMWLEMKKAGAEPDKGYCIEQPKKYPDLVLEVALTSGGVDKLKLYRRFKVPEVWIWHRDKLEIYSLGKTGEYKVVSSSILLPRLDVTLLERCVRIPSWQQARRTFRVGLQKRRRTR